LNYDDLAVELLEKMTALYKSKTHKHINEGLHGESFVLQYIALNGGSVLPGDISLAMKVSSARVAAALNSLENKGLITRQIDRNDRRKIIVEITQAGRDSTEKHRKNILQGASMFLGLLGEDDARDFVRLMGKVTAVMPEVWENWSLEC